MILDPPSPVTGGRLLQLGYRLGGNGRYRPIHPDAQGRLLSETTGLLFGVDEDGQTLILLNARTGERLLDPKEQAAREAEARKTAETGTLHQTVST